VERKIAESMGQLHSDAAPVGTISCRKLQISSTLLMVDMEERITVCG